MSKSLAIYCAPPNFFSPDTRSNGVLHRCGQSYSMPFSMLLVGAGASYNAIGYRQLLGASLLRSKDLLNSKEYLVGVQSNLITVQPV